MLWTTCAEPRSPCALAVTVTATVHTRRRMLHIHRAERADALVSALGGVVVEPPDDPMAAEVVAVPTPGVERWLTQQLATRLGARAGRSDGVCANIDFPPPGALVGLAVGAATGVARDTDPWIAARSVWPLLEVIDAAL